MSTGTGEREAEARNLAHRLLWGPVGWVCRHAKHDGDCDRLTAHILSTDAELRRVEGERGAYELALREASRKMDELSAEVDALIRQRDGYIDERNEAREALAVVREQALREARLAVAKAPLLVFKPDGPSYVDRDALLVALEALVAASAGRGTPCRGCGSVLVVENFKVADGCPCNSARGINHGLVPTLTCTCAECDPAQTGSPRVPTSGAGEPQPKCGKLFGSDGPGGKGGWWRPVHCARSPGHEGNCGHVPPASGAGEPQPTRAKDGPGSPDDPLKCLRTGFWCACECSNCKDWLRDQLPEVAPPASGALGPVKGTQGPKGHVPPACETCGRLWFVARDGVWTVRHRGDCANAPKTSVPTSHEEAGPHEPRAGDTWSNIDEGERTLTGSVDKRGFDGSEVWWTTKGTGIPGARLRDGTWTFVRGGSK